MNILKKIIQRKKEAQRGATAVEFAIIIVIFITIMFAIIEFGLLVFNQHIITNAGREGARAGIVFRSERIADTHIKNVVKNYAEDYTVLLNIEWNNSNYINVKNLDTNGNKCEKFNDRLEVFIKYDYNFLFLPFNISRDTRTIMKCE